MNATEKLLLADIQAHPDDHRPMATGRGGARSIRHPIAIECAVESERFESTHNRSACALIGRDGRA